MRYEVFLAMRNLRSRRRRKLTHVTALVAVLGIAIGVGAFIVALSLANGFEDQMREKILQGTAHINVLRSDGGPMMDYREVARRIQENDQVAAASGTTYDGAVLIGPTNTTYAVLRGLDTESAPALKELDSLIINGSSTPLFHAKENDLREIVIGVELAKRTGLRVGDVAEIVSASPNAKSVQPVRKLMRVAGIFRSGLFEYDSTWIYLSLDVANFLTNANGASVVSVQVKNIYDVKRVAMELRNRLGADYTTIDWEEANRPLFAALALERRMGLLVIALMIFMAALNITTTLILVVVERRADIAILNAMGASRRSIMSIFLMEGAVIGLCGALLGITLGVLACTLGTHYHVVSLPADVYSISSVPLNVKMRDLLFAGLVALVLSLIATIYPARAASRVKPVEMLREVG